MILKAFRVVSILVVALLVNIPICLALENSPNIIDSLRSELPYMGSDTNKVWMLRDIAYYFQSTDSDSAIIYAERAYQLAKTLDFTQGIIWSLYQKGLGYELSGLLDEALEIYQYAIDLAIETGDDLSRAKYYNIIGVAHYFEGNFIESTDYYTRAYALSDSIGYVEGESHALNNLGVIFRKQRRYDKALEIYYKSLLLKLDEKDTSGLIISHYNIGLCYSYLDDYERSFHHLEQAKELSSQIMEAAWDASHIDIAIGVALYHLGDFGNAEVFLRSGIDNSTSRGSSEYASALAYLGAIQVRQGEKSTGLQNIEMAHHLATQIGQPILLRDVLKERAHALELVGDYESAVSNWKAYTELNSELLSESGNWALEEMKARFDLKDKEITIALQNLHIEQETAKKNRYLISGIFSLLLFFISVVFLYFFWQQKRQLQKEVSLKEDALEENELLLREMHHRTKNNLQLLNSLLNLQVRKSPNTEVKEAIQSSMDSVGAISILHHRLYQSGDFRTVDLKPYIEDMVKHFEGAFGLNERGISISCNCKSISIETDNAIPLGLIINELITNAIKHAFSGKANGEIKIELNLTDTDTLQLKVMDNGNGMPKQSVSSNGKGSHLIRIFSQKYGATLNYIPLSPGTMVFLEMPYQKQLWRA